MCPRGTDVPRRRMLNVTFLHRGKNMVFPTNLHASISEKSSWTCHVNLFYQNSGGTPAWVNFLGTYFLLHLSEYMWVCPAGYSPTPVYLRALHTGWCSNWECFCRACFSVSLAVQWNPWGSTEISRAFTPLVFEPPSSLPLVPDCLKQVWQRLLTLCPVLLGNAGHVVL